MPALQFDFEVSPGTEDSGTSKIMTAKVLMGVTSKAPEILSYFRSAVFKQDFVEGYINKHAPGCGLELRGGPRPVFAIANERGSDVLGYEQDVRVTKGM